MLVGFETADDAGVYKLTPECALVQTVDFFTPIVDDPYTFGAIAAANSLSDVYAMGGRPLTALSILCYPTKAISTISSDRRGAAPKRCMKPNAPCSAATASRTMRSSSAKRDRRDSSGSHQGQRRRSARRCAHAYETNRHGRDLDRSEARHRAGADVVASIESMLTLNRAACEAMLAFDVHGCTDITGFGLLGHAREMAVAAKVTLEIEAG